MLKHRATVPLLGMIALGLFCGVEAKAQQAARNLVCKKCVGAGDLAKNAVATSRLKDGAVTGDKIKDDTIALRDLKPSLRKAINDLEDQAALLARLAAAESAIATQAARLAAAQSELAAAQARVTTLEGRLATAETSVGMLQSDPIFELSPFLTVDEVDTDLNGNGTIGSNEKLPRVLLEGVNVQIVNGDGSESTDSLNGLGSLIVGYNEPRTDVIASEVCSNGEFGSQLDCKENGHVWSRNHKSGSHNLVVGPENAYSQTGGVVFGSNNAVNQAAASVTAGIRNTASGFASSVSGGSSNTAGGSTSSVSGGNVNTASGVISSISGGVDNTASGVVSSVSGGFRNTASGFHSSVGGGQVNTADGDFSSVSGGSVNMASGFTSSISGGKNNEASGSSSSVSGGSDTLVSGDCDWGREGLITGDGSCF